MVHRTVIPDGLAWGLPVAQGWGGGLVVSEAAVSCGQPLVLHGKEPVRFSLCRNQATEMANLGSAATQRFGSKLIG